jgi:hypothetical protein
MKTVIRGQVFITKFAYPEKKSADGSIQRESICYIKVGEANIKDEELTVAAEGKASCDSRDNFNRVIGRTIAFKRAMSNLFNGETGTKYALDNEDFKVFIKDYKKQCSTSAHLI